MMIKRSDNNDDDLIKKTIHSTYNPLYITIILRGRIIYNAKKSRYLL